MLYRGGSCFRRVTGRRLTVAVEAGQSSTGSVKTELQENAVGLPGMLMQGIATIAPSFAILASFVFIVGFAGLVTPWAYLFGGALLMLQAMNAAQLAKVFRSARSPCRSWRRRCWSRRSRPSTASPFRGGSGW